MDMLKTQRSSRRVVRIAHLNGIRAFEASARHLSFAGAAQELNVTPAAVGQQVRQLEEWLGVKLFNRATSGTSRLSLTDAAQRAYPDIQLGFHLIAQGLNQFSKQENAKLIRLSASPSIASKWLLPRVSDFLQIYPDREIHLEADVSLLDYTEREIDIGIRYGLGQWDGLTSQHLMYEEIFPVCSPKFAERHQLTQTLPRSLDDIPLIHDLSAPPAHSYPSWQEWCGLHHVAMPERVHGLKINDFSSVIEQALRGVGMALGRSVLIGDELKSGALVCPFGRSKSSFQSRFCYYLVWPSSPHGEEKIRDFKEWLLRH